MRKLLNVAKWGATLGREPQQFLGAKWIPKFLNRRSDAKKRIWALRILSLSPHYFINPDHPKFAGLSHNDYLEAVFDDCVESRQKLYDQILAPHLRADDAALDYGCGPGFLAAVAAPNVKRLYAVDISTGALACARILNAAPNLEYIMADPAGFAHIPDESLDVIYSFAMVQHLTDEVFELVMQNCRAKLKSGGRLVMHIQLIDEVWKPESEWVNDTSLKGKLKYRYGLHCFGRSKEQHTETVERNGFTDVKIADIADIVTDDFDDICSQHLLTAVRS